MNHGGKRKKAGRRATSLPKIRDYFNDEDIKKLVAQVKAKAKDGDVQLLKLLVEQIFGKAPQSIELPEGSSGEITVTWEK